MLFKDGDTAFELHHCRTASCDTLFCGREALKHEVYWKTLAKSADVQSKGVLLRQDNECPYSVVAIVETRRQLKSELFPHPQYSMDLAQSDYHMFGPLKEAIVRKKIYQRS
jgi:hypothetical protein